MKHFRSGQVTVASTAARCLVRHPPITDHFRKIDRDRLLGVMQVQGDDRHYFLALERVAERNCGGDPSHG
ncbi:DUF4334 domain-containing protein [Ensifer sp. LCM 4579]|uniref:DUF4334 domain-containing protein n=1 Tax=Ensifer sp. LCM 4579 TaxID=1848292 RepID=UPI000E2F169B|nr:DUF4334 domain-containing protein [Ensifer sp. LCM 4579]